MKQAAIPCEGGRGVSLEPILINAGQEIAVLIGLRGFGRVDHSNGRNRHDRRVGGELPPTCLPWAHPEPKFLQDEPLSDEEPIGVESV